MKYLSIIKMDEEKKLKSLTNQSPYLDPNVNKL